MQLAKQRHESHIGSDVQEFSQQHRLEKAQRKEEQKKKNQNAVVTAIEPADSEPALKLKTGDAASTKDASTRKEIARLEKL